MVAEPRLDVEPAGVRSGEAPDEWVVTWRIRNEGARPALLVESWLPHGKFRGEKLSHQRTLAPRKTVELELAARCAEAPGTVVENCFLILRVRSGETAWRVLARL